ncbi:hypothetical protein [Phycisphaera mikurensis]|uniref:Uncharacterized protein n=1 Tax=Phycisphaera mikurensis (strain NBRC 102666 / KCTC 22515 / FYK2301M01) TaxID=1142394 RepID=I0IEI1_PHYMF|nr:hypothetical protein [Phycisphaera mikurensis]MBB6441468.1 hypothetical protein [Phycisphaera mikurensis]BAM03669.1 hypothetical protein PSMK_15100 [Phycisphaera mikurensis NBRC 102666]
MTGRRLLLLPAPLRLRRPSGFRVKVAVFMLPLLLPVGQNLSRQPAGADGGPLRRAAPAPANSANSAAVAGSWLDAEIPDPRR